YRRYGVPQSDTFFYIFPNKLPILPMPSML
ncbi:MAG: hypothetical protein ACI9DO_003543, partial [Reinekea sp.]